METEFLQQEYYDLLLQAAQTAGDGDVRRCYHLLNIVLHRAVDQRVAGSTIHFGGLFAKTDYLVKEYSVDATVAKSVSDLRHRLRIMEESEDGILRWSWQQDIEALTKFVSQIAIPDKTQRDEAAINAAIPKALRAIFPQQHKTYSRSRLIGDSLRMVVERWDDRFLYGTTDELGDTVVQYQPEQQRADATSGSFVPDRSYLRKILSEGSLVNIVKPRTSSDDKSGGGIIYPEFIIVQPDYLVDISSIASCFETYADTPYVALINRLKTVLPTRAIHLGNLASQFLDEEVHGSSATYAESVTSFFHHNAVTMSAAEGIDATFHSEAQAQRENIRVAIRETLENEVGRFSAKDALLEPSFFCEMLGLQGRMDLLQNDFRVLIEQKSGKGGFPQSAPDVPVYQEKHYVQMLLYMALLHYGYKYDGQSVSNSHIQSFLLYSKYKRGLVRLGAAPELLFKALMMRNQIAYCELSYARGEGNVLLRITPEQLRRKQMNDKFWNQWVRPELSSVLSPIHNATPVEQAYFLRMLRFVAMEHVLSKMGTNTKENSGFASKWHDTLDDKLLAGNIFSQLTISDLVKEEESITKVVLTTAITDAIISANFRHGDIVALYPYEGNTAPDIRKVIVHRGSVEQIFMDEGLLTVIVRLRSPQSDEAVFSVRHNTFWAMEHDFYESSSTSLYRSLHQFLTAPVHRRSLILGKREVEYNRSLNLIGDYGAFNDLVLQALQSQDLFLVIGPPGTGKTSFGLLNILKEHLLHIEQEDGDRASVDGILLMSYTNRAVDEICSKLVEEGMDFLRIGSSLSCEEPYRSYLLEERSKSCRNIGEIRQLIDGCRIIVGTTTSMTSASVSLFRLKSFSLAIIDEASQILEPHLLGLLSASNGLDVAIRKFVMIGDHKQLPAVVQQPQEESRVTEPLLNDIGLTDCRNSLFERLLHRYPESSYMLRNQGRMHPVIADFPNNSFYEGHLGIACLPHQLEPDITDEGLLKGVLHGERFSFVAVPKPQLSSSDKVNEAEATIIARIVYEAYQAAGEAFNVLTTVGVIVPYRNQITAVRKKIDEYGVKALHDITIDTVERFQGSQRELIIYGFTVQYRYQLNFLSSNTYIDNTGALIDRKLNVAMTRARRHEVLVGNPEVLKYNKIFSMLIDYSRVHHCYHDAEEL